MSKTVIKRLHALDTSSLVTIADACKEKQETVTEVKSYLYWSAYYSLVYRILEKRLSV